MFHLVSWKIVLNNIIIIIIFICDGDYDSHINSNKMKCDQNNEADWQKSRRINCMILKREVT